MDVPRQLTRRMVLSALGAAGFGATAAILGRAYGAGGGRLPTTVAVADAGEELRDLPEVRSRGGLLDYELTVATTHPMVGGTRLHLDTYNDQLPGPVLRIRPGDRVRVLLRNQILLPTGVPLNALPPLCADRAITGAAPRRRHGLLDEVLTGVLPCVPEAGGHVLTGGTIMQQAITTNLHVHGLQVSPAGMSDNVFVMIGPLGSHQYEYVIPADHPAGLHWYHPHHHGSTTHQAWSGLAGPIVLEGDIDEVPEIADMRERTIVISALRLDGNGENPTAVVIPTGGNDPFTTVPAVPSQMVFTLNGQLAPEVRMQPGETQRWRVLNAAPHRAIWLHVERHAMHQVGQDGIPFDRVRPVDSIMLARAVQARRWFGC